MAVWDKIIDSFTQKIVTGVMDRMSVQPIIEARAYRQGYYKPQLKTKQNQFNDNIGLNLTGLLVNRVVSQMIGKGFTLDFDGEGETEQERYINAVLEANKQEVLFHRAGVSASEAGTGYLLIIPDGVIGEDGQAYPRLQLIDPAFVTIETLPEDYEFVIRYTIAYKFQGADGKEHERKREIEHVAPTVTAEELVEGGNTWRIVDSERIAGGNWQQTGVIPWPYDFPPLLHWQNEPSATDVYGEPDVTPAQIELQNRINFVASNISKLIRYFAHPMRIGKGVGEGDMKVYDGSPEKILLIPETADVLQLEALGDLASSMAFLTMLRQSFFACGRVVDLDSMTDKLGALTNFGLRVMYQDNLALIATKRELFGDMLAELARRLQILAGMEPIPCTVVWPDFLPVDEAAKQSALEGQLRMGVVSKETVCGELGRDWEQESERMDGEQEAADDINRFMQAFNRGNTGFNMRSNNNA
jgi:hypothetical protein